MNKIVPERFTEKDAGIRRGFVIAKGVADRLGTKFVSPKEVGRTHSQLKNISRMAKKKHIKKSDYFWNEVITGRADKLNRPVFKQTPPLSKRIVFKSSTP